MPDHASMDHAHGTGLRGSTAVRQRTVGTRWSPLRMVSLAAALVTLGLVLLAAWAAPGPDVITPAERSAIRMECGDRIANGLSPDMSTCVSWAAEARLDARRAADPINPLPLVIALAAGALAGSVVHLATARAPGAGGRPSARLVPLSEDRA